MADALHSCSVSLGPSDWPLLHDTKQLVWYMASKATISPVVSWPSSFVSSRRVAQARTQPSIWNVAVSWRPSVPAGCLQKKHIFWAICSILVGDECDLVHFFSAGISWLSLSVLSRCSFALCSLVLLYLSLHVYWASFATMAASMPWPTSSLSNFSVRKSSSSWILIKLSAGEWFPLPTSCPLDFDGHGRDSALSSWQMKHNFHVVC